MYVETDLDCQCSLFVISSVPCDTILLTLSMLAKKSSRHFKIFFLFFPEKRILIFHANYLLRNNLHEISKPIFWEE